MAVTEHDAARAIAYFRTSDDAMLLHRLLADVAPRVRKIVARYVTKGGGEERIPAPADIPVAGDAASLDEATATVAALDDFALLQAVARAIGQRVEALEIVASAQFPEGSRVTVPETVAFPPRGPRVSGEVTAAGTSLRVALENGKSWQGPPSLARPAPAHEADPLR